MENTFHNTFRPVVLFAQVCGLMPVTGIFGNDGEKIRFTWTNPLHLYDIGMSGVALFFDYFDTAENLKTDFSIDKYASTVFYTVCLLTTVLFLRVAQHLPGIARDFSIIERSMSEYEEPKRLGLKIKLFLSTFVVLATVEHGSMGVLHFRRALEMARNGTDDVGRAYYVMYFTSVSLTMPYSSWATVFLTLANAICTFNWNFLDFFLIGMSLEVAAKFNQISQRLTALDNNNDAWMKIYTDYGRVVALTKKLDKTLSGIILTSFFSNLYHLSLQLMRSLSISGTLFHKLYFYFSLSYLILRLLTTLFCLANVNEAGKKPKDVIFSLESNSVSSVRLLQRVLTDDVHFTGNGMFIITRGFVFSVSRFLDFFLRESSFVEPGVVWLMLLYHGSVRLVWIVVKRMTSGQHQYGHLFGGVPFPRGSPPAMSSWKAGWLVDLRACDALLDDALQCNFNKPGFSIILPLFIIRRLVIGTIVTYQAVLLQFDSVSKYVDTK